MRKKIVIAVTNDLVTDQRVHKVASTLTREVGDVTLLGRSLSHSQPIKRGYATQRMKLLFNQGPLFYIEYNIRLCFFLLRQKVDIIVANDLDTLLGAFIASKIKRIPLVYDSHEYFTEVPELIHRPLVRKVWLRLEKSLLPQVRHSYTVCQSIADIYRQKYGIDMKVVRNVPYKGKTTQVKKHQPKVIIYQGAINIGRGIEESIKAMHYVDNAILWIYGKGDIEEEITKLIIEEGLQEKVVYHGQVPFEDLHLATQKAVLGLSLEKGKEMGESYYYSLPNKLFDYIHARIPVLITDIPEKRKILNSYEVGAILESYDARIMAEQINKILAGDLDFYQIALEQAANDLCWENEENELLKVYKSILR